MSGSNLKPAKRTELEARAKGHTPAPWSFSAATASRPIWHIAGGKTACLATVHHKEADAAFIVLAVNAYDAMVAALRDARRQIAADYGEECAETADIDAALALARGAKS